MIRAKVQMSERSKKLASYIRRTRTLHAETQQDNQDDVLDKGFAFLKIDIAREFHDQIKDLNHEPGCMGTLGSAFASTESHVFKIGEEDKGLTISFNSKDRSVEINGRKPIRFYYLVQVRLCPDGMTWGYVGGEDNAHLVPIRCKLDTIVEKGLFALFDVEA